MRSAGDSFLRYTIISLLGRGGMGEVYEAEDTVLKRRVALKLIPKGSDSDARERMLREARAAAAFEHPNVVLVFDAGVADEGKETEETFLAMEIVRGKSLRAYVGDSTIPIGQKLRWLTDTARALAAAHRASLVHRDVKPDNLMVRDDGRLKVLDFGIAKRNEVAIDPSAPTVTPTKSEALTEKGSFVGTPKYAAPEQLRGEAVDGRTDQYAWGVTAYELLSGETPFEADTGVTLLSHILTTQPPSLRERTKGVPVVVDDVILRALSKSPSARFANLDEVADAIEPFADRTPATDRGASLSVVPPVPPTTAKRAVRSAARWFFYVAAAVGTLFILLLVIGAFSGTLRWDVNTGSSSASANAGATTSFEGFSCRSAKVTGTDHVEELSRQLGIGACARLAIETGLPWSHEKAKDVGVDLAKLTPVELDIAMGTPTKATLRVGGLEATAEAASPMLAMQKAVLSLAPRVAVRPLTEEQRLAWGASDDASARRIERVWRKLVLGDLENAETSTRDLVKSDGDSPWPHAISALVAARGSAVGKEASKATIERLGKVSPTRAKALEGVAIIMSEPGRVEEAIKLFRQSYRDAPDDPDVAGLYGAVVLDSASEEGTGVIDRVAQQFPTYASIPLTNAITSSQVRDKARNAKYIAWLNDIFPEKSCEGFQFDELFRDSEIDLARKRLASCRALYGEDSEQFLASLIAAELELTAHEPDKARELAQGRRSDPRDYVRTESVRLVIASYVLGGRMSDALTALEVEMTRQRDQESPRTAVQRAMTAARLRRLMGSPNDPKLDAFIQSVLLEDKGAPPSFKYRIDAYLLLAPKSDAKAMEATIQAALTSRNPSDAFYAIPLMRRVMGDKETLAAISKQKRVSTRVLSGTALDVALLMEATNAPVAEIEAQYRLAMMPGGYDVTGFDKIAARLRLARLLEKEGNKEESRRLLAEVDRVWAHADPGLREIVAKMK